MRQFDRKNVRIVGYDATPPAADAIRNGTPLVADVIQHPRDIGVTTIRRIRDHFAGLRSPKVVPVPVGIVDRESLEKTAAR